MAESRVEGTALHLATNRAADEMVDGPALAVFVVAVGKSGDGLELQAAARLADGLEDALVDPLWKFLEAIHAAVKANTAIIGENPTDEVEIVNPPSAPVDDREPGIGWPS